MVTGTVVPYAVGNVRVLDEQLMLRLERGSKATQPCIEGRPRTTTGADLRIVASDPPLCSVSLSPINVGARQGSSKPSIATNHLHRSSVSISWTVAALVAVLFTLADLDGLPSRERCSDMTVAFKTAKNREGDISVTENTSALPHSSKQAVA